MGQQGPLTAQALGRSPYEADVVQGEGEEEPSSSTPRQQYDGRGRPINPESKRINRDIIRSHNEVMLLVGVAEADNQPSAAEAESAKQHESYELLLGSRLTWATRKCVEMVGVFGVDGLRQRILVYKQYCHSPCFELYSSWRKMDVSLSEHVLPGVPASLLSNQLVRSYAPGLLQHLALRPDTGNALTNQAWNYIRCHLELFAALQRLGLIPSTTLLPSWKFFIPFMEESLIPLPPAPKDYSLGSLLGWVGSFCASAAPLVAWAATQKLMSGWRKQLWIKFIFNVPSPKSKGRPIRPPTPDPQPSSRQEPERQPDSTQPEQEPQSNAEAGGADDMPQAGPETGPPSANAPELTRRQSLSTNIGGDDFGSDEEDNEVISATLVSFDVEATEATEMPQGLWSAELRLSGPETRTSGTDPAEYLSTALTRFPSATAAELFSYSIARLVGAPLEALSLRLAALSFCARHGLPTSNILGLGFLTGLNTTWLVNFLGVELLHFAVSGEFWSMFTTISQHLHKSESEWETFEGKDWGERFGLDPMSGNVPLVQLHHLSGGRSTASAN